MPNLMAQMPMWKGKYPMSDTTHEDDLQMRADINEHMHRMPRHEAEARAHADYRRDQIAAAAGHHWNGMKAAHAAGNEEAAKKHGMMYALALHQLGHKDLLNPPPEVVEAAKDPKSAIGHFKAHGGDVFSLPPEEPSDEPQRGNLEPQVKARAMAKAEITEEYPKDHQLGMRVPMGGSSCAKCSYVSDDLKKCGNEVFQKWNGGAKLPAPAAAYCCDLYEIKKKGSE